MESRNKKVQVIVNSEKLPTNLVEESSHTNHYVANPIEELGETQEIVKDDAKDNVPEEEDKGGDDVCRFCLQEGSVEEELEEPCGCIGSIKYAHRKCVAQWCNVKRDTTCEICKKTYRPSYFVTTPPPYDDAIINMSEGLRIPFTETRILTPLQLIERGIDRLLRSMNMDLRNPTFGVLFGTALLLFLVVLVIRDAYNYDSSNDDKFTHFLYCVMVFIIIPTNIITLILECRDQRERREREREIQMQLRGQE